MVGYTKVANMFGMTDTKCLRKWVKQYQEKGEEFFNKIKPKEFLVKTPQKLEDENLYLKAENEYLKKLLGITTEKIKKKKNIKQ